MERFHVTTADPHAGDFLFYVTDVTVWKDVAGFVDAIEARDYCRRLNDEDRRPIWNYGRQMFPIRGTK